MSEKRELREELIWGQKYEIHSYEWIFRSSWKIHIFKNYMDFKIVCPKINLKVLFLNSFMKHPLL